MTPKDRSLVVRPTSSSTSSDPPERPRATVLYSPSRPWTWEDVQNISNRLNTVAYTPDDGRIVIQGTPTLVEVVNALEGRVGFIMTADRRSLYVRA